MRAGLPARLRWLRRWFTGHPWVRLAGIWLRAWPQRRFDRVLLGRKLSTAEIGMMGEWIATRWLRQSGRIIFRRNFRGVSRGEVDIVARHRGSLTFVEVKTRTSRAFGRPADNVGPDKQRLIIRGAQDWLREVEIRPVPFRFDIAEITLIPGELPQVNIMENAFQLPDSSMAGRTGSTTTTKSVIPSSRQAGIRGWICGVMLSLKRDVASGAAGFCQWVGMPFWQLLVAAAFMFFSGTILQAFPDWPRAVGAVALLPLFYFQKKLSQDGDDYWEKSAKLWCASGLCMAFLFAGLAFGNYLHHGSIDFDAHSQTASGSRNRT